MGDHPSRWEEVLVNGNAQTEHVDPRRRGGLGPLVQRPLAWASLAAIALVVGCEGGGPAPLEPSKRSRMIGQSEMTDPGLQQPGKVAPAAEPREEPEPSSDLGAGAAESAGPAAATALPDGLAEWTKEHFVLARKRRDPRLLQAVQYLGSTQAGKPEAVEILVELLKPVEPEPTPGVGGLPGGAAPADMPAPEAQLAQEGSGSGGVGVSLAVPLAGGGPGMGGYNAPQAPGLDPQLLQAVMVALVANNTESAWEALRSIVTGQLKTADDRAVTFMALQALGQKPSGANEEVLFYALTQAAEKNYRPASNVTSTTQPGGVMGEEMGGAGQTDLTAGELQQQVQQLLENTASASLRQRVAEYLVKKSTPQATRFRLRTMMEQNRPENIPAQLVIYQDRENKPLPEMLARFETQFATFSAEALGHVLGVVADAPPTVVPPAPAAPGQPPAAPGSGWGPPPGEQPSAGGSGWGPPPGEPTAQPGVGPNMGGPGMGDIVSGASGAGSGGSAAAAGASFGGPAANPLTGSPAGGFALPGGSMFGPSALGSPGAAMAGPSDPDLIYRVAKQLWGASFANVVGSRLVTIPNLTQQSPLLLMARTMPVDVVRAKLYAVLKQHLNDGPGQVIGAAPGSPYGSGPMDVGLGGAEMGGGAVGLAGGVGVGAGVGVGGMGGGVGAETGLMGGGLGAPGAAPAVGNLYEPGFLVVVKMLPIEKPPVAARPGRTPREPAGGAGGEIGVPGGALGLGPAPEASGDPSQAWTQATESLVKAICQQCLIAAKRQSQPDAGGELPIPLHPGARVTARYNLKWPAHAPAKLTGFQMDPLEVHYVCIEDTTDPVRLLRHYKSKMKRNHREIGNNEGAWFAMVQDGSVPGRKQSIDVLITRPSGAPTGPPPVAQPGQRNPGEPLVIQILTVEVKDPRGV